ncbi:MAG: pyrophosphatase PpaX [Dehalococcoidia bacterium]
MTVLLWDLDDTLLNTLPARMAALAHAYQHCTGRDTNPLNLWRSHQGGTLESLGEKLLGNRAGEFVAAYRDRYYGDPAAVVPFDGIRETLEAFAGVRTPMAVVTSKVSWGATEELERAGLLQYFRAVVGFDDTELHKPDPEPLFAAMDRMMLHDPSAIAYIGDSPADVQAARRAGCIAIAATWGTLDLAMLRAAAADHEVHHPAAIATIFAGQGLDR